MPRIEEPTMIRTLLSLAVVSLFAVSPLFVMTAVAADEDGWTTMFDGKTLDGWKVTEENPGSFKVEDGAIVAHGERAHLFYVGDGKPYENFEFKAQVMTLPKSNAGIYFHTRYQPEGWPMGGYEAQVNNTHSDPKKTGSLYGVVNVLQVPAADNEWFDYDIKVEGNHIRIEIDGKPVVDYYEPEGVRKGEKFERALSEGTFALQAHDPISVVKFRDMKVRRLE